jgi:hypothetical protein
MPRDQASALVCALADLCGAYQAFKLGDMQAHDWKAHQTSIIELAEAFGLEEEVPEDCT